MRRPGRSVVLGGGSLGGRSAAGGAGRRGFTRERGAYTALAISANGTRVAAGAELDGELDVWSVDDHALLLAADLGPVWPSNGGAVAISADGTRAAASSGPDTVVADVATGAVRRYPEQRTCCTGALAFGDGGRKLASARYGFWSAGVGDGNVVLIDLDTGAETPLIQHNDIYGWDKLAVSGDGTTVLTFREHLQIWHAATGQQRLDLTPPEGGWHFEPLGLGADGATFAVVTGYPDDHDKLWFEHRRSSDGSVIDQLPFPTFDVTFAWSPADLLFGRAASAILAVVDPRATAVLARACSAPAVDVGGFSRDGSRLLDRSSGSQHVLDAASGTRIGPAPIDGLTGADELEMSPDGHRLAWTTFPPANADPTVVRVEVAAVDSGARSTLLGATPTYHFGGRLAFSADSSRLAALDVYNGIVDVFDVNGARLLAERQLPQPYEQLLGFTDDGGAVRFALDGEVETLAWQDGTVTPGWSYPKPAMIAASFDSRTVVVLGESASPSNTAYRDGVAIATLPGTGFRCTGGTPFVLMAPGGGTLGLGYGCSRDWTSPTVPGTSFYETTTGAFVQKVPRVYPILSWDGNRFADGAVIWCR